MKYNAQHSAIFEARSSLRRRIAQGCAITFVMTMAVVAILFGRAVTSVDSIPPLSLDAPVNITIDLNEIVAGGATTRTALETQPEAPSRWTLPDPVFDDCSPSKDPSDRRIIAFLPGGDLDARASLSENCDRIDLVLADAYRLLDWSGSLELSPGRPIDALAARTVPVLRIDAAAGTLADRSLGDPGFLSSLAFRMDLLSDGPRSTGLCLDLTPVPTLAGPSVLRAIEALSGDGTACVIGAPEAAFWRHAPLVDALDLAIVRGFRTPDGPADPPAPAAWLSFVIDTATSLIPSEKLVIALGTQGHFWRSGDRGLRRLGYSHAMSELASAEAEVLFVPWANAARSRFVDDTNALTEVWLPDAVSLHNQMLQLAPDAAVAVWPLGSEDPTIWPILDGGSPGQQTLQEPILLDQAALIQGNGPAIIAAEAPRPGRRLVTEQVEDGWITDAIYDALPAPARLDLGGWVNTETVGLSFTELPPPDQWPVLSSILDAANVQATFLVPSPNLLDRAETARLAVAAGHVVGLHLTRTANGADTIDTLAQKYRQLLLIERTGAQSRMVEMPAQLEWASLAGDAANLIGAGYIPLMPTDPASSENGLIEPQSRAIMDASNRLSIGVDAAGWTPTLLALPSLLAGLMQDGYAIAPLHEGLGLDTAEAMPAAHYAPGPAVGVVFGILAFAQDELNTLFFFMLAYSAVRSLLYLVLALVRRPRKTFDPNWSPPVSVVIPAYNEAVVIESCVQSILESPYPDVRVVIVDDGSTDGTFEVVQRAFGTNPRVALFRQANGGKWAAANRALGEISTPFFLIADADSVFTPDTIGWLMQQFKDPAVGAVAGVVEVGNRSSFLGQCQSLEYIVSQSVMRRAQEVFDGILVVPGAVGAWRTRAVRQAHLFSGQTVTEDADLTVAVHRAGYKVRFQEQARSITEAPTGVSAFMRQRVRWTFGMLQTSWKHRGAITEGRTVGFISIIDAIWFGVASSIFAPLVDLLLVLLVVQGAFALSTGGAAVIASLPASLFVAYFALTLLDVANTLVAFRFERRMDWKLLAFVPLLRFGYRQLLYIATLKALAQVVTGTAAGWNKLDRTGAKLSLWSPVRAARHARADSSVAVPGE